jgi:hypothetical protein
LAIGAELAHQIAQRLLAASDGDNHIPCTPAGAIATG